MTSPEELKEAKCTLCKSRPTTKLTDHCFIDLPKIQAETEARVEQAIVKGHWDENAAAITRAWMKQGLRQRCITRDLKWGVRVPM